MTDTAPKKDQTPEETTETPEGFDKPTGPFANRKTPSFSEEVDKASEQEEANSVNQEEAPETSNVDNSPRIAELEAQLAEMKEQALRAMAETENMRKRTERERGDMQKYAITGFAKDLLNVSDNLRRALESVPEEAKNESDILKNLLTGVEATERELLKIFDQKGVRKIEPLGEKFDPNLHEVMFEAPSSEYPEGAILQVIEAGYVLNDRLLRPARVGVSKGAPEAPKDGSEHHIDQEV